MINNKIFVPDAPNIIYQASPMVSDIGQCHACSPIVPEKRVYIQPIVREDIQYVRRTLKEISVYPTNYTSAFLFDKQAVTLLNESAITCLHHFSIPHYIRDVPSAWTKNWGKYAVNSALEEMVHTGLLVPEDYIEPELSEKEIILAAWLHITNRCNLNCSYCYLPHDKTDMSMETGKKAVDALFRSAISNGYRQVKLKYSGGEPLLRFPLITALHQYAQTLAEKHNLELDGVILSNGTLLTPEIVNQIKSLNLRLMISLDGLGKHHDCHRHFPDGSGTFPLVSHAIELALSKDLIPDISVTVSSRNIRGLPQLMEWILERDLPFSINFYRENDFSAPHSDLRLEEEKIISGMLAAYKVIESHLPHRSLLASLADRANLANPHLRTCSVGHSYMVFDPRGNISKCQMQMNQPVADIRTEDPLKSIRANKAGIQNISVEDKGECKSCQWKYWCAGGCPLEARRITGRYDAKSPNCNIYKALYPEVIRLEGLRLLKHTPGDSLLPRCSKP